MSAGLYPGGVEPAGAAPVSTSVSNPPKRPVAIRYEGIVSDWVIQTTTGAYSAVTPVEQGVVLSLMIRQGDIKSSPTTGNTLNEIEYLNGQTLAADIDDRVRRSNPLARYLDEKQAEIVRIDHEIGANGFKVAVYFKDLTADKNRVLRRDASVR
jgi:hypothetical protein